jgi:predicted Zn-ribbon and HTH transcriptional regulator
MSRHISEDEREDARLEAMERRAEHHAAFHEPERARCAACGTRTDVSALDERGVCPACKPFVEDIEEMCR